MNKEELMKMLLNLYQSKEEFDKKLSPPCTQDIINGYIRKLELKLKKLL